MRWARVDAADRQKRQEMLEHLDRVLEYAQTTAAELESALPSPRR